MVPQFVDKIIKHPKFSLIVNLLVAIVSLVAIYQSGTYMLDEPLWAYKPMTFFTALWFLFNVIFGFIFPKTKSKLYFLLSFLSGMLLYLAFPDPSITPFIFIGFVPLLYIVEQERDRSKGAWRVFRYSYSAFLLWNILTTFWVANTSFVPSIVAFTLNSLFMTIPFILYFNFRKRFSMNISLIAFIAFWLSFEMIHLRWEISWPWLTLGNAFSTRSLWIQWYEFTGHLGGSLWVLLMNALIISVFMKIKKGGKISVFNLLYPMAGLMIPMFISFFVFFGYQEKGEWQNVTIVQPNFEPHYEKFDIPQKEQLERFLDLSKENLTDSTDYLVYPETSFSFFDIDHLAGASTIRSLYQLLDSFPETKLVSGLVTYKMYNSKEPGVGNLREIESGGKSKYIQVQNSAVQLSDKTDDYQVHIKGKLVPGAEIFPYSNLLFFLEPIVKKAGGSTAGHGRSKIPTVFTSEDANVAPSICYESIYGYWMAKYVQQGADLIFVVTNDGWWDNTPGHRQHLSYSVLRAIELRKSIARSANSGISCTIDQHGRIFHILPYDESGAIQARVQANPEKTFYARNGDLLGRIAYLFSLVFLAFMFRVILKKKQDKG